MQSCLCFISVSVLKSFYISSHLQANLLTCTFLSISNESHTGLNWARQDGNKWLYSICFKENTTALIILAALRSPILSVSIVLCIIYAPIWKPIYTIYTLLFLIFASKNLSLVLLIQILIIIVSKK